MSNPTRTKREGVSVATVVCQKTGAPMQVGFTSDEYEDCQCGAPLTPVEVYPARSATEGTDDARS